MDDVPLPLGLPDDDLPVHPLAALFPMLPEDELQELAEDIADNGLRNPIVLDDGGRIIDGRNRYAACRRAGVEPRFEYLNGQDVRAFIVSQNINRRHLTSGQRAMAVAMMLPDVEHGGDRKSTSRSSSATELEGVSRSRVSMARAVLRASPPLADQVMAGESSLDQAFRDIQEAQGKDINRTRRLRTLRERRPDLANAVIEDTLTLEAAERKATEDADALKQERWAATVNLIDAIRLLDREPETASGEVELFDASVADQRGERIDLKRLKRARTFLGAIIKEWGKDETDAE